MVRNNSLCLNIELQWKNEEKIKGEPIDNNKYPGIKASKAVFVVSLALFTSFTKHCTMVWCCLYILLESDTPNNINPAVTMALPTSLHTRGPTLYTQ